jgi:hypothetical protein
MMFFFTDSAGCIGGGDAGDDADDTACNDSAYFINPLADHVDYPSYQYKLVVGQMSG